MVDLITLYSPVTKPIYSSSNPGSGACFKSARLGILPDFISAKVTESLNGTFTFSGEYLATGSNAENIVVGNLIECYANTKRGTGVYPQLFRITGVRRTISNRLKVDAEHISYDLSKYIVEPVGAYYEQNPRTGEITPLRRTLAGVIEYIEGSPGDPDFYQTNVFGYHMDESNPVMRFPFHFSVSPASSGEGSDYGNVIKEINFTAVASVREWIGKQETGMLSVYGGELSYNNERIIFNYHRGGTSNVRVLYGKNLKEFVHNVDGTTEYQGFFPYYEATSSDGLNRKMSWYFEESEYQRTDPEYCDVIDPAWGFLTDYGINVPIVSIGNEVGSPPVNESMVIKSDLTSVIDTLVDACHSNPPSWPFSWGTSHSWPSKWSQICNDAKDYPNPDTDEAKARREHKRQFRAWFLACAADAYAKAYSFNSKSTITVDFQSLYSPENSYAADKIELGDLISINYNQVSNTTYQKRVIEITYNVLNGRYEKFTLGDKTETLATIISNTSIVSKNEADTTVSKSSSFESDVKKIINSQGCVTGAGTGGYLAKWSGSNTIENGPQLGNSTSTFLRNDGQWATPAQASDTWRNIYLNNHEFLTNATTSGYLKFASTPNDASGRMGLSIDGSSETGGKKLDFGLYYDLSYFTRDNDYDYLTLNSTWLNSIATKATTLAGYGISDAYIQNGVITLGSNTITPLTSHQTVTAYNPTLAWGTQSAVASIGGTALNVTMPSNPLTFPPQASDENKVIKYAGMDAYTWDFVSWSEISNRPTIPTIRLNGTNTTSADFYAPTGAGTSGSILRSNGSGHAPTWSTGTYLRRPFSYISASGSQEVEISQSNGIVLAAGTNISLNKSEATNKTTITFNVSASPSPDPPAPCLIEGTQIKMADGSTKAIEDVKTGDEILSWDVNANTFTTAFVISQSCNGRSLEFMSHLFDDGSYIVTYGVHMVYNATKGYPIDIAEFKIGDTTINADGDVISYIGNNRYRVRRKDSVNYYALTTSNNLYFAGDILNGMTVFAKYRAADKLGLDIPDSLKLVCQEQEKIIDDAAGFQKSDAYLREISAALKQKSVLTKRINEAKAYLDKTDYYDNKYVEGALSEEEWAKTIADRATMRDTINAAEPDLAAAESQIKDIQAKYYKSTKGKRSRFKSFCALDNANLDIYRAWLQKGDSNEE